MKTTKEIMYEYITEEDHVLKLYDDVENEKWYSEEELKEILKKMQNDCSDCYTGLTKDDDFERAFSTMNKIVFDTFEELFGE